MTDLHTLGRVRQEKGNWFTKEVLFSQYFIQLYVQDYLKKNGTIDELIINGHGESEITDFMKISDLNRENSLNGKDIMHAISRIHQEHPEWRVKKLVGACCNGFTNINDVTITELRNMAKNNKMEITSTVSIGWFSQYSIVEDQGGNYVKFTPKGMVEIDKDWNDPTMGDVWIAGLNTIPVEATWLKRHLGKTEEQVRENTEAQKLLKKLDPQNKPKGLDRW